MTNRFKSALCGHLIQKLRVKCSVMYCFMYTSSHIALLQCHSSACCGGMDFVLSGLGCLLKMKKTECKKTLCFFCG